jgi:hypothetical protein
VKYALLIVLVAGCGKHAAKPKPCDQITSFDECKARKDCSAVEVMDPKSPGMACTTR